MEIIRNLNLADATGSPLLHNLCEERGVTIVVVTHDLELAGQTKRVIRLKDGRVSADERERECVAE